MEYKKYKKIDPKQARLTIGLTQTQMAKAMGVARGTWLKWERQEQGITAAPYQLLIVLMWLKNLGMFEKYLKVFEKDDKQNEKFKS